MTIHERLADSWRSGGLAVLDVAPVSGSRRSPSPTAITLQVGQRSQRTYLVFAWRITHEGKGRSGDNLRIQATSFGKKNSPIDVTEYVLGVGWSEDHGVFVAFDPWVKRSPGTSSSVHIERSLVERAAAESMVDTSHRDQWWDPRLAFTPDRSLEILAWSQRRGVSKTAELVAMGIGEIAVDQISVAVDPQTCPAAAGVRVDDRISLVTAEGVRINDYLWRVRSIEVEDITGSSKRNRFLYRFRAERSARL